MFLQDAETLLAQLLHPWSLPGFLETLHSGIVSKSGRAETAAARTALLGDVPSEILVGGHARLADKLTFHAVNPSGPPAVVGPVSDAASFRDRIDLFHRHGYSVRFPELRPLSPALDRVARALEMVLHQPVSASAFWSRGSVRAPVHYDEHDILAIQLKGRKTWHLSGTPSPLCVTWPMIPGPPPTLKSPVTFAMEPGDMLYVPRGLAHTVDGTEESIHIALGFTPLTVRAAIVAVLDRLAEQDLFFRDTLVGPLGLLLAQNQPHRLMPPVATAVTRLQQACASPDFFSMALQRASARAVSTLAGLSQAEVPEKIELDSVLRQRELAFSHITANEGMIDLSYPGGHIYVHRGAQQSLLFMIGTPSFRVRDIPGEIEDDVRIALARQLVSAGYLGVG
jgi:hypothetical protein